MDPLSILASVTALATATFQIVSFLGVMKEGGNDRLRVTTEVNSLWMVLKLLEVQLESTNPHEEAWLEGVRSLKVPNGVFDQISASLQKLNAKLKPQTGHRKALQTLRWPLTDKRDVEDTLSQIERLKSSVSLVLSHSSLAIGTKVNDALVSQKVKAVIDWLTPLNFLARQESIVPSKGTGAWFLESDTFDKWRKDDDLVMWCPGIPGAGKTFLTSIVIEKLRELHWGQNVAIFMLYCNYNDPETQSVQPLIASLLKQDIQQRSVVDKRLGELHEAHYKKETRPTLEELQDLLDTAISNYEKTFIVVDALDEMLDEKCRSDLLDCLRGFKQKTNLLVTTRPLPTIKQLFGPPTDHLYCDNCSKKELKAYWHCTSCSGAGYDACQDCHEKAIACPKPSHIMKKRFKSLRLDIQAADKDLQTYIVQRIADAPSLRQCVSKKIGLQDEILERVTQFANGMFLLAKFHMDALSPKLRPSTVLTALKNLPTEIDSTYDQAMERIQNLPPDHREMAMCFLSWIAFTDRALTAPEIEHATETYLMLQNDDGETFAIDVDNIISASELSSMCAGMVIVEGGNALLVHYTAVTYLDNFREKWFPGAYAKMARTCLTYLLFDAFDAGACTGETEDIDFEQRQADYPLLGYASLWWGRFAKQAEFIELRDIAMDFLQQQPHVDASVQALWYTDSTEALTWTAKTGATGLHLAAYFGLEELVADLLGVTSDIDAQDSLGNTAMMYAAIGGNHVIVAQLLEEGASVNVTSYTGSSALHTAALKGNADVMRVLLRRSELDVNVVDPSQHQNALMLAAAHGNTTVVECLLSRDDLCPNLRSNKSALMFAALENQVDIVALLLKDPRVSIDDQDDLGETALMLAAFCGHTTVVEKLLDAGADANITDGIEDGGGTPLLRAIDYNRLPVVRAFLRRNVNGSSKDKYDRNLLHGAAINGRDAILQLLLEQIHDLDVNEQDKDGRVPLHDSARFGYLECIEVLLRFGARTDIKNIWGETPLKVAKETDHLEAFKLILKAREAEIGPFKRVDTSFSTGEMPLWVAAKRGNYSLVDSIIEAAKTDPSVDLDSMDLTMGRTPLQYASDHGHTSIVKSLLDAGVDIDKQDQYGRSAIQLAAMYGHVATARALLAHRPNINLTDQWGKSPLDSAESYGYYKIAVLLLQNGATLSPNDIHLHSVLCAAAAYGYSEVVLKLIKAGAETQRKDEDGMTPFQTAKQAGHEKTAQILLGYSGVERLRPGSPVDERRFSVPSMGDESEEDDVEWDDEEEDQEEEED